MSDSDTITSCLKARIEQRFGVDMRFIERGTSLHDLGIDSLHTVDILLDIENELGFNFEKLALPPNPTLGQLSDAIAANLQTMAKARTPSS
jgi:acyl carrier protein